MSVAWELGFVPAMILGAPFCCPTNGKKHCQQSSTRQNIGCDVLIGSNPLMNGVPSVLVLSGGKVVVFAHATLEPTD